MLHSLSCPFSPEDSGFLSSMLNESQGTRKRRELARSHATQPLLQPFFSFLTLNYTHLRTCVMMSHFDWTESQCIISLLDKQLWNPYKSQVLFVFPLWNYHWLLSFCVLGAGTTEVDCGGKGLSAERRQDWSPLKGRHWLQPAVVWPCKQESAVRSVTLPLSPLTVPFLPASPWPFPPKACVSKSESCNQRREPLGTAFD